MTISGKNLKKSERFRAHRIHLSPAQIAIEQRATRLRAELAISEFVELPLDVAVRCLPECEVLGLRHVPGITLKMLSYARTDGYRRFGALARRDGDSIQIVFNDAHPPPLVRVNVMEEIFHVLLGHRPDVLTLIPRDGRYRTHNDANEEEASGCAIASLVPFAGLQAMLASQWHTARIAEHFAVPIEVVHDRIAATKLGELMNAQFRQLALVPQSA